MIINDFNFGHGFVKLNMFLPRSCKSLRHKTETKKTRLTQWRHQDLRTDRTCSRA